MRLIGSSQTLSRFFILENLAGNSIFSPKILLLTLFVMCDYSHYLYLTPCQDLDQKMICYLGKCRLILTLKKTTTTTTKKTSSRDFAGGPVVRTLRSHCQGSGFNPWSGNYNNPTAMRPKNKTKTLQTRVFSLKNSLFFCLPPDCWKPPVLPVHEPSHRRPRRL